jgi:hypothetical protein
MSLKKAITSAAVSAIAAGSLVPLSSAASARDWDDHSGRIGSRVEHRDHDAGRYNAWRGGDEGGYRRHHDHDNRNLAIGAFATVLGIALAAEANRVHDHYYDDRD